MAVTLTKSGTLKWTQTATTGDASATANWLVDVSDSMADGTGLDQCDVVYGDKDVALSGSGTNNLDVNAVLADVYGTTISLAKIKFLYIHNKSTTAGDTITIGNHASAALLIFGAAAHTYTIGPNGKFEMWEPSLAGKTVTASTGDILKILNDTSNANTYDIAFGGASA